MIAFVFAALLQSLPQAAVPAAPVAAPADAAPTAPAVVVAPPTCDAPPLVDRPGMEAEQINAVVESAQAYTDCMSDFVESHRGVAQDLLARFNAEAETTNTAVADVNAFVERFNSWRDKLTSQAETPTP